MKEPNLNTTKIKILTQQNSRSKIPNTKIKVTNLDLKHQPITKSRSKKLSLQNLKVDLKTRE